MSKSPVYIGAGSAELSVQSALNMVQDGEDSAQYLITIADWVHLTDGTTVIDRITGVNSLKYSAKEYAQGDKASTGGSAKDYAQKVDGGVSGATSDHSAKAWSVGGTGVTTTSGKGAAKQWATTTGAYVDTADYSAKEYAIGTTVAVGSAKDWAVLAEDSVVDGGTGYSSLHYAAKAAADLVLTNADVVTVEGIYDNFDDRYLGAHTTAQREVGAGNIGKDHDGNALVDGALYYDTTLEVMKVWNDTGSAWNQITPTTANQTQINTLTTGKDGTTSTSGTNLNIVQVDVVADNIASVNTVATNVADVVTVANDLNEAISEIETAALDLQEATSEIDTVAVNIANVNIVGTDIANVNTVAGKATEIGRLGTVDAVADMALLGLAPVITDMDLLGAAGVIGDIEIVSDNISDVNNFADLYQIDDFSPADPNTDGGGNALAAGDLAFDTTAGEGLKVWTGSTWSGTINTTEGVIVKQEYTANGSTQHYILDHDQDMEIVYLNGVKLLAGDGSNNNDYFSVSGGSSTTYVGDGNIATHIYFHTAPTNTFVISIVAWGASNNTLAVGKTGGTYSGAVTFQAGLTTNTADINGGTIDGVTSFNGTEITTFPAGGINNTGIGVNALNSITTGDQNTALGKNALTATDTGQQNTSIGYDALKANVGGSYNTALGDMTLVTNVSGTSNVAVGKSSLYSTTGSHNTAIGEASLFATTGSYNVGIGKEAGDNITSGSSNIIIGAGIDADSATGSNQLNIGGAIKGDISTFAITFTGTVGLGGKLTAGSNEIEGSNFDIDGGAIDGAAIGQAAPSLGTFTTLVATSVNGTQILGSGGSGSGNQGFGSSVLTNLTNGGHNTGVGASALSAITSGSRNTALGEIAGYTNSTANDTTTVGYYAGRLNVAADTTAIGSQALTANTSGIANTAVGFQSLYTNATGANNTGLGYKALYFNTGGGNTALGYGSLYTNVGGASNVAVGVNALFSNTSGGANTAVGLEALFTKSTGNGNTAVGYRSLYLSDTNTNNTAVGYEALKNCVVGSGTQTGAKNVAVGVGAGVGVTDGYHNVAMGYLAGYQIAGGRENVALGYGALYTTTGNNNVAIGDRAGFDVTVGGSNIFIGGLAGTSVSVGGSITGAGVTGANTVVIGDNFTAYAYCKVAFATSSDERDKSDIVPMTHGLDVLESINPISYFWDTRTSYWDISDMENIIKHEGDGSKKQSDNLRTGFSAQNVKAALGAVGYTGTSVVNSTDEENLTITETNIIPFLVNAVKELSAKVKVLESA